MNFQYSFHKIELILISVCRGISIASIDIIARFVRLLVVKIQQHEIVSSKLSLGLPSE